MAEKESLGHKARLQGVSEAEYVRRRLGFGANASQSRSTEALLSVLEKRGIDTAELFSRDYFCEQAKAAGLSEAGLVRHMLDFAAAPPAKRQTAAVISELNRLGLELSAIGNNANQLALAAHTNRRPSVAWEEVVVRIRELGDQVESCLEKVLGDDD